MSFKTSGLSSFLSLCFKNVKLSWISVDKEMFPNCNCIRCRHTNIEWIQCPCSINKRYICRYNINVYWMNKQSFFHISITVLFIATNGWCASWIAFQSHTSPHFVNGDSNYNSYALQSCRWTTRAYFKNNISPFGKLSAGHLP